MTCSFCGSRNDDGEHRCGKCGRRPGDTLNGDFTLARTEGALATKPIQKPASRPAPLERISAVATQTGADAPRLKIRAVQQSLFQSRPTNLIEFAEYAPEKPAPKSPAKPRTVARRRPPAEGQGQLDFMTPETKPDFLPPQTTPKVLSTTVEAMVSCDFPVATPAHRVIAASLDASMALLGFALFLIVYFASGGTFTFDRLNLLIFTAALALIGFSYGLTWALLGTDTFGMRVLGLRLVTFDGFPLERRNRIVRFAGSCFSFCTVFGQFWGLWDEENLTWQDHISSTFPTPRGLEAQVFRRG